MRMIVVLVVIRMFVVVEAARPMIVIGFFSGMAVHEPVGVAMLMLVQMVMNGIVVPMGVGMHMTMDMVVLVFVLEPMDGLAAALPIGKGQTVEIAQALILEKDPGRHILQNASLVHHQRTMG